MANIKNLENLRTTLSRILKDIYNHMEVLPAPLTRKIGLARPLGQLILLMLVEEIQLEDIEIILLPSFSWIVEK